jgi:hypothetical protein
MRITCVVVVLALGFVDYVDMRSFRLLNEA